MISKDSNNALVSVLVPVYGVEHFIERCAQCLFEQTYENIEYVFVDDCTPDNSVQILKHTLESFPQRKSSPKWDMRERVYCHNLFMQYMRFPNQYIRGGLQKMRQLYNKLQILVGYKMKQPD